MLVPVSAMGARGIEIFKDGGRCPPYKFSLIQDISRLVPILGTGAKEIKGFENGGQCPPYKFSFIRMC